MPTSKGKQWENYVSKKLKDNDIKSIRLRDVPMIEGRMTRGTANPCDFVGLTKHGAYLIECKACKDARLPISRITQLEALKDKIGYAFIYVAIYYYSHNKRVVISLQDILNHHEKSIKYDCKKLIDLKIFINKELHNRS